MSTLSDVTEEAPSVTEYIDNMTPSYRGGFIRQRDSYSLSKEAVQILKKLADDYEFVAFFADWCGDSRRAIPVLSLLEQELGIRIRALGGMTKPPFGSKTRWAVPPSPKEVEVCDITSSPTIIVYKKSGEEVGRMKTKPRMTSTVEEELIWIIEKDN
ncbi:MAG: thioredoxin family protein [Candidatus Thorarchaeota archaeon]|jgi:thiol-disulfide isomerase/thioredoxin